jgi:hypothetical protein
LGLGDRACGEAKLDFFAAFVVCDVRGRNAFHAEYFDFVAVAAGEGIVDAGETGARRMRYLVGC